MGLTNLTADLDLIQALDKRPNAIGGLSAAQLQAKFDEAANAIKTYINGTLIPELDTQVAALKAVNRLVYCAQDVPKTALPADIITVGKNWFYPKPAVGDTVLGKNMYVARVTTISGNDATLTGIGTVLTPKDFNVLNLLTVKAVGGVGGNIVAEGDLSVSGYTGLAGDLDVTGDTDITGDLDVVGNVTVSVDASVSGALAVTGNGDIGGKLDVHGNVGVGGTLGVTGVASLGSELYVQDDMFLNGDATVGGDLDVTGDATVGGTLGVTGAATFGDEVLISSGGIGVQGAATFSDGVGVTGDLSASGDGSIGGALTVTGGATFGDNVTLAAGKTLTASELATRGIILSDGIQGHEPVSIYGGNDEIELIGDNDGPVSLLNVKDISASGDVSANGDLNGTALNLTNANNKSVQIEVAAENTVYFNGTSDAPVVIGNVDTPTSNGHAANKSYVDSAVSGKASSTSPVIKGGLSWNNNGSPSHTIYGEVAENELGLFGTGHTGQVKVSGIATPTSNYEAANKAYVDTAVSGRVAVAQGVGHAGEFLVVGSDGNVTTVTMTAWAGGSF